MQQTCALNNMFFIIQVFGATVFASNDIRIASEPKHTLPMTDTVLVPQH